jgi:hypothetical protein
VISRTSSLRLAAAALALTAGLALAGCGNIQPGVAAQVGDQKISVSFVDEQIQWFHANSKGATEPPTSQQLLWEMIFVQLMNDMGKRLGASPTAAELAAQEAQLRAGNALPPDLVPIIARREILVNKLSERLGGQEQFVAEATKTSRELGVTLNPRFGVWNADQFLQAGPESFGSGALVTPRAQPRPDAELEQLGQPAQ